MPRRSNPALVIAGRVGGAVVRTGGGLAVRGGCSTGVCVFASGVRLAEVERRLRLRLEPGVLGGLLDCPCLLEGCECLSPGTRRLSRRSPSLLRCAGARPGAAAATGHPPGAPLGLVCGDAGPPADYLVVRQPRDDNRDVARALAHSGCPPAGAGTPPLERRALVGVAGRHEELLRRQPVVVDGVRRRRLEQLADHRGGAALGVLEDLVGALEVLAPDEVEDLSRLVGRHPAVAKHRPGAWPLVRLRPGHVSAFPPAPGRRGTGTSAWGRTRPACGRPSTR